MKTVFIFVALISANLYFCLAGKQKLWADSKQPININVYGNGCQKGPKGEKGDAGVKGDKGSLCQFSLQGEKGDAGDNRDKGSSCQCSLQNSNKPSAHIEAVNRGEVTYPANQIIKDWCVRAPNSHLSGGMKYHDGKLTVPTTGRYYIYLQVYYRSTGRIHINVNNKPVTIIQSPRPEKGVEGTLYAGGVFNLKAGDVITFTSSCANFKIYMWSLYTYFGAYLI